jgi:hypothetical protein
MPIGRFHFVARGKTLAFPSLAIACGGGGREGKEQKMGKEKVLGSFEMGKGKAFRTKATEELEENHEGNGVEQGQRRRQKEKGRKERRLTLALNVPFPSLS